MDRFLLGNLKVTVRHTAKLLFENLILLKNQVLCVGDLTWWSHLITFRTQKLSTIVAMILFWRGK